MPEHTNRLIHEKSPYLLQHAHNPVDWYPWGEEAFEQARTEDKPIFLSIGYSTCHWCHVMEHESFEDEAVAALMNEAFVNIKVDREERPDIDGIYMTVAQMTTGHGGWPLTILMTPDKKPFFAGTYFPRDSRHGRVGMLDLIPQVQKLWTQERGKVDASADDITRALQQGMTQDMSQGTLGIGTFDTAVQQLAGRFDPDFGGFAQAPKFPTPHTLSFLLRDWQRRPEGQAKTQILNMVETTLTAMRAGGIFDQVGYGFHRYSTDRIWLLPHFEKMLYDQALLVTAYTEAFQASRNPRYRETAQDILTYVLRDMTDAEGGFYSAEDADSEGEEGKFYVWTLDELREVLGTEDARIAATVYGATSEGNFVEEATRQKTGANILHRMLPLDEVAAELQLDEAELAGRLPSIRDRLFTHREGRVHPYKDDKILTDWNGLMIAALAKAGRVFDEPSYLEAAERAVVFILDQLRTDDGQLLHRYRSGEAGLQANIDDYAFLVHGLIELYRSTFNPELLQTALDLNNEMIARFEAPGGGFFFTPDDGEDLLVRQKEVYDGAVPSGNSIATLNLIRLARLTGTVELEAKAASVAQAFAEPVGRVPSGHAQMMVALEFMEGPSYEVVIVGNPEAEDTRAMLDALNERFLPNTVVLLRPPDGGSITGLAPYTATQTMLDGAATAYVCQNFACHQPTTDIEQMLAFLK